MYITLSKKHLPYKNLLFLVFISLLSILINISKAEAELKMQLSPQTQKAHQFLINWEKKNTLLDLNSFVSMEMLKETERVEFEEYFSYNLRPFFKDQFYAFAVDGAGGYYAFWVSPEGKGEYPVVLIESEGQHEYLAPSLWKFINDIPKNPSVTSELHEYLDDMIYDYQQEHSKELSKEEMKAKFSEVLTLFQTEAKQLEKTTESNITAKNFTKLLQTLDTEQNRLLVVHSKFGKDGTVPLSKNDEQAFALTFLKNINDAYSYMQRNRDEHVTMYWYGSVHDNLQKIRMLSEKGYNRFLPDNDMFKTWKTYMVTKLENKLAKLPKSEQGQDVTVKQLSELFDYFIARKQ